MKYFAEESRNGRYIVPNATKGLAYTKKILSLPLPIHSGNTAAGRCNQQQAANTIDYKEE